MDEIGFVSNINAAVISIDLGRTGWATKGKEQEGRVAYDKGIDLAMSTFQKAQALARVSQSPPPLSPEY